MNQLVTLPPYAALRLVEFLKAEGIPSETTDATLTAYEMGGGTAILCVWVLRKGDLEEARRLMQEMFEENERKAEETWTCTECGETSSGLNEVCWNCCDDSEDVDDGADVELENSERDTPAAPIEDEIFLPVEKGSRIWICILALSSIGLIALLLQGIALLAKP